MNENKKVDVAAAVGEYLAEIRAMHMSLANNVAVQIMQVAQ